MQVADIYLGLHDLPRQYWDRVQGPVEVNETDASNGDTALLDAADKGDADSVKVLIASGANVNTRSNDGYFATALLAAAFRGHADCVEALLAAGADVKAMNENHETALTFAAFNGHADCVKALLAAGADINAKDERGDTALMKANAHHDVVAILRAAGAMN